MRIVITGSTGLIGRALTASLLSDGHEVVRLVRREPVAATADGSIEAQWNPQTGFVPPEALADVDALVHLAGAGVGDHRWNAAYKRKIRDSRVHGTKALADSFAAASGKQRPSVFVSGSAIGYYGDTGGKAVDESAPVGTDFLAGVCAEWEAAADPAREAGIRTVHPRMGIVVAPAGGAYGRILPLAKLGLGGRMGNGRQYWSLISLTDVVAGLRFAIDTPSLSGPVNFTSPQPATNKELTATLGRLLHRPSLLPVPGPALRLAIGEFAGTVLYSQQVLPARLLDAGFTFKHPTPEATLSSAL